MPGVGAVEDSSRATSREQLSEVLVAVRKEERGVARGQRLLKEELGAVRKEQPKAERLVGLFRPMMNSRHRSST